MANAEIILTASIPNLGAEADIVKVRRGYARNFLIPQGKALEVTPTALRKINHLRAIRAEREAREVTAAEELASKIGKLNLSFTLETGETGKAFGSVTSKDIHDRLVKELGIDLPKHAVDLDRSIKESGDHEVPVKLHPDVTGKLRISIVTPKVETEDAEGAEEGAKARKRTAKS
ncbi:MAG: 50S ribosomal protein L9 [Verrucomicrobia bacterium 61-8]|nr:50S ribosomal protein L9 [Verrucomicrobiota bacterium]OJU97908.1 MAG: 50S ribosomal protein L9 [Verrucomicrobia bacterium 61-8]